MSLPPLISSVHMSLISSSIRSFHSSLPDPPTISEHCSLQYGTLRASEKWTWSRLLCLGQLTNRLRLSKQRIMFLVGNKVFAWRDMPGWPTPTSLSRVDVVEPGVLPGFVVWEPWELLSSYCLPELFGLQHMVKLIQRCMGRSLQGYGTYPALAIAKLIQT